MECECEFCGERIAGGMPLTGLEPFPPWYWEKEMENHSYYFRHLTKELIQIHLNLFVVQESEPGASYRWSASPDLIILCFKKISHLNGFRKSKCKVSYIKPNIIQLCLQLYLLTIICYSGPFKRQITLKMNIFVCLLQSLAVFLHIFL